MSTNSSAMLSQLGTIDVSEEDNEKTGDTNGVFADVITLADRKATIEGQVTESLTDSDDQGDDDDGRVEEVAENVETTVTDNAAEPQTPDTDPQPSSTPTLSPASIAEPIFAELKAESKKLAAKAQAVVNARFRQAGRCAGYIQTFGGDEGLIRADLESRGVDWPDANCLNPVETVLAREFIFEDEDCVALKNRVSEFARIIRHLVRMKITKADDALVYIKKNKGLRGLYAKLDADGNLRIEDEKEEVTGTDTIQTDAQKTETAQQAAEQPNGWDSAQTGTVACAVTKKVEQVVADAKVVIADATGTLDLSSDAVRAEAAFKQIEAEALEAEKLLKAAQMAAEAAAEKAEDELAGQIEEAQRIAMEKAAEVGRAQRLLDLAQRVKKVPVWGDGRFTGEARPASMAGGEWAYGNVSCVLIHTDEEGTFHVIGNVTPPWQDFCGLIDTQFPA